LPMLKTSMSKSSGAAPSRTDEREQTPLQPKAPAEVEKRLAALEARMKQLEKEIS